LQKLQKKSENWLKSNSRDTKWQRSEYDWDKPPYLYCSNGHYRKVYGTGYYKSDTHSPKTPLWVQHILTYSIEQSPSREANQSSQLVKKYPTLLWNPKVLYRTQVPATCPYPEPTPSSPHNPLKFPEDTS
jgi:hypothetical protein